MSQYRQRVIFASANIYPFVWSVWSEPDVLPYAFDTSEAWVFCRGERTVTAESGAEFVFSRPSATGAYFAYVTERERRR